MPRRNAGHDLQKNLLYEGPYHSIILVRHHWNWQSGGGQRADNSRPRMQARTRHNKSK